MSIEIKYLHVLRKREEKRFRDETFARSFQANGNWTTLVLRGKVSSHRSRAPDARLRPIFPAPFRRRSLTTSIEQSRAPQRRAQRQPEPAASTAASGTGSGQARAWPHPWLQRAQARPVPGSFLYRACFGSVRSWIIYCLYWKTLFYTEMLLKKNTVLDRICTAMNLNLNARLTDCVFSLLFSGWLFHSEFQPTVVRSDHFSLTVCCWQVLTE